MNSQIIFTGNQKVIDLYREFKPINGNLYHYTSSEKLDSIRKGSELWITRSDSFLDKEEVQYGLNILKQAAAESLNKKDNINFNTMLAGFNELLINSYIFSTSYNPSSEYLLNEYGKNIIEFSPDFSMSISHMSYHSIKTSDSYRMHHFSDNYEYIEGQVIYELEDQKKIANMAAIAMSEIIHPDGDIVEIHHVRKILLMCVSLFKCFGYHKEEEYRIILIRKLSSDNIDFNIERENKEKYIKAVISGLHQRFITNVIEK